MPGPRTTLILALALLGAGLGIMAHNAYIERSGARRAIAFANAGSFDAEFRPHWSSVHFVSLVLTLPPEMPALAGFDAQGFPSGEIDLHWEIRDGNDAVASGRPRDSRMRIERYDDRVLVLGAFRASTTHHYRLHVDVGSGTEQAAMLDALQPRVEIGRRPGQPLLAYSMSGHGLSLAGAALLLAFTRRRDKSWPYVQILAWWSRVRGRAAR